MLAIGQLDRKILIQGAITTRDALGGATREWGGDVEFGLNAFIEWKSVKETDKNKQISEIDKVFFYVRNMGSDVKLVNSYDYRIAYPVDAMAIIEDMTKYYYITGIQEFEGRDRFLRLVTSKRDDEFGED